MTLPTIAITAAPRGWLAKCSHCGWELFQTRRPVVDVEATNHRAKCATKEKPDSASIPAGAVFVAPDANDVPTIWLATDADPVAILTRTDGAGVEFDALVGAMESIVEALTEAAARADALAAKVERVERLIEANNTRLARSGAASYTGIGSDALRAALAGPAEGGK